MYQKNYDSRLGIDPPSQWSSNRAKGYPWLPLKDEEGTIYPWIVDGKLDPNFHEWLAERWFERYGGVDIYQAKADVIAYMMNNPHRLEPRWLEYQGFMHGKFQNAQIRLQHGCEIPEEEQEELRKHTGALTRSLPPTSVLSLASPGVVELPPQLQPVQLTKELPPSQAKAVEGNSTSTKEPVKEVDISKELSGLTKSMPKPNEPTPNNELEEVNRWLADPILRQELPGSTLAKFELIVDEQGHPIKAIGYKDADEIEALEKLENID